MRKAISSAKSATAPVSAKPRMPIGRTASRAPGLRATLLISEEKMLPMPRPTPNSAITAMPAPRAFAAATSMGKSFPFLVEVSTDRSVQVHGVVQVDAGQDGEHIGLQEGHQQFEPDQCDVEGERQRRSEERRVGKECR